ncbi:cytochrome p450 4c1, partial [Lasius niger]
MMQKCLEVLKKKQLAMLDLLIMTYREGLMSDLDIREEIDTFMFEGHDTTAMGIIFALLLLAEHKDIQNHMSYLLERPYFFLSMEFIEIPIFGQIQMYLIRIDFCPRGSKIVILIPIYRLAQDRG